MSKFKESLKEEIKDEFGDLVYEKAKAEIKEKVREGYESRMDKFLRFLGFDRGRKAAIDAASKEIQDRQEIFMSETMLGIVELFTINFTTSALEVTASMIGENEAKPELPNLLSKESKEKRENERSGSTDSNENQ